MNFKLLDSWLKEYVKTDASAQEIGRLLSLSSVSVEGIEKKGNDFVYDIEVTTNRPDLMSILGLARETAAVLKNNNIKALFSKPKFIAPQTPKENLVEIKNDPKLVNRICAVAMEVKVKQSPNLVKDRLETSGVRGLNNVIDVTNYVMKVLGHPTHVFDLDRLNTKTLIIREGRKGEIIKTLDEKQHILNGGEIVAVNDRGEIVDLLGIMGLQNSVVTKDTKKILFFIDNNDKLRIRKASMSLGIRTDAAVLNEKALDPNLAFDALVYGIKLYEEIADGMIISDIIDIYPNKVEEKVVNVSFEKINKVIGVKISPDKALNCLTDLGFEARIERNQIIAKVPTFRTGDIEIEEDIIEEIARIYGYHNLPDVLPPQQEVVPHRFDDEFYWEERTKQALKYWGFTEVYTYSFVSEEMYEGPLDEAITIQNPLTMDFIYMRNTLIPSLLKAVSDNKTYDKVKIFEIANVYFKTKRGLPDEVLTLSGVVKKEKINFFEIKGVIEQLLHDLGIKETKFKNPRKGGIGASVYIEDDYLGEIEVLDTNLIDFELNFEIILRRATLKKEMKVFAKYPPITEDLSVVVEKETNTEELIDEIKAQSHLIVEASLKDTYENTKTFHIIYQDFEKNLTKEETAKIREKIVSSLKRKFSASFK